MIGTFPSGGSMIVAIPSRVVFDCGITKLSDLLAFPCGSDL